jgi:hypothetical protein
MFEQAVNRIEPKGSPEQYKTYAIVSPMDTHTRVASCAEVDCPNYLNGWRTTLDLSTDIGKMQARYIRDKSGRAFEVISDSPLVLEFRAGQKCFTEHRVPLHREPLYVIRGGDYRGNPMALPVVQRSERDWLDDFGDHQQKIRQARERG